MEKIKSPKGIPKRGFFDALRGADATVWLSLFVMGLAGILSGQIIKGVLFLLIEAVFLYLFFMPGGGLYSILRLPSLGDAEQGEVWNEALGIYEYTEGDRSQLILLYGIVWIFAVLLFLFAWRASVVSGARAREICKSGGRVPTFLQDVRSLFDERLHALLMTPPTAALLVFTVLPLVYMMSMAFTNYSREGDRLVLFDWVGLANFKALFSLSGGSSSFAMVFLRVLLWTFVWAFFATFSNYFLGMLVALMINKKGIKLKALWRTLFVVAIAVPQFVTLLLMQKILDGDGILNKLLAKNN